MDGRMTAAKADGAELTAADVRELIRLLRANGWKHSRTWREYEGDCLRVNTWRRGEQLIEAIFVASGEPVCFDYMDVDTDDSLWNVANTGVLRRAGLRGVVDVLVALGVLPAHLSSAWQAAQKELKARINRLERQVIVTMTEMPLSCRYHGSDFDFLGREYPGGPPRCDSCKQPWRLRQLLAAAGGVMPE